MPRLALIQAEIRQLEQSLAVIEEDSQFHPWQVSENTLRAEKMRELLVSKRKMEHMIRTGSQVAVPGANQYRNHAEVEDQDVSTIVYLMLVVAIVGVSVAMLMAAAGVLSQ